MQSGMQSGVQSGMHPGLSPYASQMSKENYGQSFVQTQPGIYQQSYDQTQTGSYSQPAYGQSQVGSFVQPELVNPQYQSGGYQGSADAGTRTCPLCMKPAGKGKFCIECGQFIGMPGAAGTESGAQTPLVTGAVAVDHQTAYPQQAFGQPAYGQPAYGAQPVSNAPPFPGSARPSTATQIADAQNAYGTQSQQQQPQVAGGGVSNQRQPVTSFNLDPSKLGFAQPLSQSRANQQSGLQGPSIGRPGSVEF